MKKNLTVLDLEQLALAAGGEGPVGDGSDVELVWDEATGTWKPLRSAGKIGKISPTSWH